MLPNYRGLLAIIPPAVLRALTSQSAVLRFSRAAILAGLLPVWCVLCGVWGRPLGEGRAHRPRVDFGRGPPSDG